MKGDDARMDTQEVIRQLKKNFEHDQLWMTDEYMDAVCMAIDILQSAYIIEDFKKGHWVTRYNEVFKYYCDKCGIGSDLRTNYCPNCGAYMVEHRKVRANDK